MGWLGRAGHLVAGLPEGPMHGHLLQFTEVEANLMAGRPAAALDAARRGQEIGRRYADSDLVALGLHGEGRALIQSGQVVDGLALLDEAMVIVKNGQVAPFITGVLYCHTVAACHEVADVRRMARWTELTEQWLATLSAAVGFEGLCGVHRAQLHLLHGEWDGAERGALRIAKDFDRQRVDYAAEAWYVVAEVRRLRGDPTAAEAYEEAHSRGRDPQPGRALLRLREGDAKGAATSVRSALVAAGSDPLRRAPICAAAVEIAVATDRLEAAAEAESELAATAAKYTTSGWRRRLPQRAVRCCWPRARPTRPSPYFVTPAGAGTSWVPYTTPPVPVFDSSRHTGRSVTRCQPRRNSQRRSRRLSGSARTGPRRKHPTDSVGVSARYLH